MLRSITHYSALRTITHYALNALRTITHYASWVSKSVGGRIAKRTVQRNNGVMEKQQRSTRAD